jgi:hypothetical protein
MEVSCATRCSHATSPESRHRGIESAWMSRASSVRTRTALSTCSVVAGLPLPLRTDEIAHRLDVARVTCEGQAAQLSAAFDRGQHRVVIVGNS